MARGPRSPESRAGAASPVACLRDVHPLDRHGLSTTRSVRCTCTASSALAGEVSATSPVDPRGLAASVALRHLPHADQRVAPAAQHQLLQVPDLGQVPVLRRREDPLPQPPYVVLVAPPVDGVPVEDRPPVRSLRSVSTPIVMVSNLSFGSGVVGSSSSQAHLPTSAPFRAGHQARYPASYPGRPRRSRPSLSRFPVAFRPPAFASWASCSRRGFGPSLRSAYRTRISASGPRRGFHVPHA